MLADTAEILAGRYELVRRVNSGGFGHVYRAIDSRLGRPVAIKVLRHEYVHDGAFRDRFAREARLASWVADPNVVSIFDYGEDRDRLYLVMEWISGLSLQDLLDREGVLSWEQAAPLVKGLLAGLAAIHAVGTVHRDVSLRNALLAHAEVPKIIDFGIAKGIEDVRLTKTGMTVGSPLYIAPEQITGEQVTPATDLYALGATLFHLLTGHSVFTAESSIALLSKHLHEQPRDPRFLVPAIPDHVAETILMCLDKEPSRRYPTASAVAAALFEPNITRANHKIRPVTEFAALDHEAFLPTVLSSTPTTALMSKPRQDRGQKQWLVPGILLWILYLGVLSACYVLPYQWVPDRTSAGVVNVVCAVSWALMFLFVFRFADGRIYGKKRVKGRVADR